MQGTSLIRRLATAIALSTLWINPSVFAGEQPQPSSIRIGIAHGAYGNPPRTLFNAFTLAQKNNDLENEFAKDNIQVEWIYFKGAGPAVNEAFSNNQIDFALQGDLPSIVGRAAGLKTHLLMVLSTANTYIIVKNSSSIQRVEDLKNRKMAFHKGTNMHVGINKILAQHHLRESDVAFFNLDATAALAAFYSNDIEGLIGSTNLLTLVNKGAARIIYSSQNDDTTSLKSNLLVSGEFRDEYPELTYRFVKTLLRSVHYLSQPEHEAEVLNQWHYLTITPDVLKQDLGSSTLHTKFNPLYNDENRQHLYASVAIAKGTKLIRKPLDIEQWIDDSFLTRALREMNLENYW